jgi:hypothetical protein
MSKRKYTYNKEYNVIQGGSNMTETNCDLFTHNQSRSYLNHLVFCNCPQIINFNYILLFVVVCSFMVLIALLTQNGKFLDCATFKSSDRYMEG